MNRIFRLVFAAVCATIAMGFATSAAHATGTVSNATSSSVATITGLNLNDSGLGSVIGNVTLTLTIRTGLIACNLTTGVTIGWSHGI